MWARICELILGIWLAASYWIFSMDDWGVLASALSVLLFAALSFCDKLNKIHLLEALPASWLLYIAYSYPVPWLPFGLQNLILTAFSLLMFAIIPSRASDHPSPWKKFLQDWTL